MGIGKFFEALPREWPVDLHAAELDSISGRIAQLLHPNAKIHIMGYQDVLYPDGFFDASFSNVPFGNYGVADHKYLSLLHL